jgi:hypothetical protein
VALLKQREVLIFVNPVDVFVAKVAYLGGADPHGCELGNERDELLLLQLVVHDLNLLLLLVLELLPDQRVLNLTKTPLL